MQARITTQEIIQATVLYNHLLRSGLICTVHTIQEEEADWTGYTRHARYSTWTWMG